MLLYIVLFLTGAALAGLVLWLSANGPGSRPRAVEITPPNASESSDGPPPQPVQQTVHEDPWSSAAALLEQKAEEPKDAIDKTQGYLYKIFASEENRRREGEPPLPRWMWRLYPWLRTHRVRIVITLLGVPLLLSLVVSIITGPYAEDLAATSSTEVAIRSLADGPFHEWHDIGQQKRAIPYCRHYEKADEVYQEEVVYLVENDMVPDHEGKRRHARCILRLDGPSDGTQRVDLYRLHRPEDGGNHARWLLDAPTLIDVIDNEYYQQDMARVHAETNTSFYAQHPAVYVLRDGRPFYRFAARTDTHPDRLRPVMVGERDLQGFLDAWRQSIVDALPVHTPLNFCMCAAHLGIIDRVHFYLNPSTSQWEVWQAPRVREAKGMKVSHRRMRYPEKLAPLPYYQNMRLLQAVDDEDHSVAHRDAAILAYYSTAGVDLRTAVDARELFWTGSAEVRRSYDPAMPFALAVPLRQQETTLAGIDLTCYHHCDDLHTLITQPVD